MTIFLRKLYHTVSRLLGRIVYHRFGDTKHILLVAHNALTAEYLAELWELLRHDRRLKFFQMIRTPSESPEDRMRAEQLLPMTALSQRIVNIRPWDLVVMADHPGPMHILADLRLHPVLRIPHGISDKKKNGANYYYDARRMRDETGRLRYSCIFESSHVSRLTAVRADPSLSDVITVVGNPRLDKIAVSIAQRGTLRATLGLSSVRPTILIASSWSANGLFLRIGDALFQQAQPLLADFEILLRPHPHLFKSDRSGGRDWRAILDHLGTLGFRISSPDQSLSDVLAVADVVVSDDISSVSLYAAAAGKRLVLVRSGSTAVNEDTCNIGEGTFIERLGHIVPTMENAVDLRTALDGALGSWPPPGFEEIQREINGEPGRSTTHIRNAVYRLLKLKEVNSP